MLMRNFGVLLLIAFNLLLITACKRDIERNVLSVEKPNSKSEANFSIEMSSETCVEDEEDGNSMDTILKPTILGYHLINQPY